MYNLKATLQEIVVEVIDLDTLPVIVLREIECEQDDFPSLIELGVSPGVFTYLQ